MAVTAGESVAAATARSDDPSSRSAPGRTVVLLTSTYPPERAPGGKRMAALARGLLAAGRSVVVVAPAPHYPGEKIFAGFGARRVDRRCEDGITVIRFTPRTAPRTALVRRTIAEVVNAVIQFAVAAREKPDVLVATVPSLALAPMGAATAGVSGARFVLDVRDLHWLYAEQLGKVPRWIARVAELVTIWAARQAEVVSVTTPEQRDHLLRLEPSLRRAVVVPNGVDEDFFTAFGESPRSEDGRTGRLRVVYAGLIGYAQGIGVLLDAAASLDASQWEVVVAGDGPERAALEVDARERGLDHVRFTGYLDAPSVARLLSDADVLYAQLRGLPVMESALPTKLLDYLTTGRPVVYGGTGAGARTVRESGGGIVIAPDDPAALCGALQTLRDERVRMTLGHAGRRYIASGRLRRETVERFVSELVRDGSASANPGEAERPGSRSRPIKRSHT